MRAPAKSNGSSSPAASIPEPSARPASRQIYVGADHAGFQLKQKLVDELTRLGYEPVDVGPKTLDPADDYPDYGKPVAEAVSRGVVPRGVLTCGTGLGMAYIANRFPRVRAAVAWSPEIAELARKHNDANVLVLPSRFVSEQEGMEILHRWLDTGFEGGRHARRVEKIDHANRP
jgi:ribose 5-phosphate isomerase B